jgi:hypothetical protein
MMVPGVFDVNLEPALDDQEELVLGIVLVPVEFALDNAEPNDCVVDGRQRLVEPAVGDRRGLFPDIERAQLTVLVIEPDLVGLAHGL